jgi:DNA modification methylase
LSTYQTHDVDPRTLVGADYNPRKMSDKQRRALEQSLGEFGFVQPIVVNEATGVVVGGHQRLTAALALGITTVPVVYVNLTVEREKALNVALNKISGDWDFPALINLLGELEPRSEFDLTGFDIDEFQALEREWLEDGKAGRDGKTPPPPRVPQSRLGEVYRLGEHVLVCGDSTDPDSYKHTEAQTRMMFTDPPYNIAYEGGTAEKLTILNDSFESSGAFRDFLLDFLLAANTKNAGVSYICYASSEAEAVFGAWRLAGMHSSGEIHTVSDRGKKAKTKEKGPKAEVILWDKNGFTLGRSHYQNGHEPILYGWHPKANRRHWCGDRNQSNVWVYPKPARNAEHPTMKPVELVERSIRNSSEPGDWVLDPFGGSGTTLVAAENIGRRGYLIELDPRFVDVIIARYQSLDGHGPVTRLVAVDDSTADGWWNVDRPDAAPTVAEPAAQDDHDPSEAT